MGQKSRFLHEMSEPPRASLQPGAWRSFTSTKLQTFSTGTNKLSPFDKSQAIKKEKKLSDQQDTQQELEKFLKDFTKDHDDDPQPKANKKQKIKGPSQMDLFRDELKKKHNQQATHQQSYAAPFSSRKQSDLYITDIPADITQDDLSREFSRFGRINSIKVRCL